MRMTKKKNQNLYKYEIETISVSETGRKIGEQCERTFTQLVGTNEHQKRTIGMRGGKHQNIYQVPHL